ncbi:FAD-dependent oxidoreductase [Streptomyces sp. NPDC055036]
MGRTVTIAGTDDEEAAAVTDVIVVGAGPTGLLLAGDLAAAGHSVTLVERRPEAVGNLTRALAVHARTMEQLDARGLADELVARGYRVRELRLLMRADEVREAARRALGSDYGMHDARWISRFHSDERQVSHYRVGRVFLAGDAAHVHSPAGGMGMNTGLHDAANLSWKLSAVLARRAGDSLLDTYESERHPVGAMVLRASGIITRFALARSAPLRALRSAGSQLLFRAVPFGDRVMRVVTGIGIAYPSPRGAHPLVGRRAPDLALSSGRLYEALRAGRFVAVGPHGDAHVRSAVPDDGPALYAEFAHSATRTLLVRPDGYIAWAADHPDPAGLRHALTEWTGQRAGRP